MSPPTEHRSSPHSSSDLDTVFFLPSSLATDCSAPHIAGQIGYFMFYFMHWNSLSLCSSHLHLLSIHYLSITFLTLWPLLLHHVANSSFACSTITCSLTEGVQAAERDVSDRAGGLAEVACYRGSFIDKSACLSACLPGPEEQLCGAAC